MALPPLPDWLPRLLYALPIDAALLDLEAPNGRVVLTNRPDAALPAEAVRRRIPLLDNYEVWLGDARAAPPPVGPTWRVTPRQRQVLDGVVAGQTNKEIALALGISVSMVEQHVRALFRKAGVDQRAGLVAAFWRPAPVD